MELLIGAGNDRKKKVTVEGMPDEWAELVTLDIDEELDVDVHHDLNILPLPFDDNTFDEVHAYEVLEHCGKQGDWRFFLDQFSEFHRILKPSGFFVATVPMWDSQWAWGDPGHTRIISDASLTYLSQAEYEKQIGKTNMTDYRGWYKADFDLFAMEEGDDTFGFVLKAIK